MTQLTLRNFDEDIEKKIREIAREKGISLNKAALYLLRKGAGLNQAPNNTIGDSLDHLVGAWSEAEADTFLQSLDVFESIDESLWS